jgi:hypothetical protein
MSIINNSLHYFKMAFVQCSKAFSRQHPLQKPKRKPWLLLEILVGSSPGRKTAVVAPVRGVKRRLPLAIL